MSPTKPIAPAVVTAAAVRSAERANRSHGRRATSTPSAAAVASPRANALRSRANGNAAVSASASAPSVDHATGGAERSPISQNSMPQLRFGCDRQDERDEGAPSRGDHHTGEQEPRRRPRAYAAREAEHQ